MAKLKAPIKVEGGKSYKFKKTKDIDMLEKTQTDFSKYSKILINKYALCSMVKYFTFIEIDKKHFQVWVYIKECVDDISRRR